MVCQWQRYRIVLEKACVGMIGILIILKKSMEFSFMKNLSRREINKIHSVFIFTGCLISGVVIVIIAILSEGC